MKPLEYWTPDGFEISSFTSKLEKRKNETYKIPGIDKTKVCTYTYNELGFRGDSIHKSGFKVMSIGDSMTEGMGVNDDETWPRQLCKLIPNAVDLNFGNSGRGNDYIARCLMTYYDVVKPDLVLIMYVWPHRRDVYTKDGGIEPFHSGCSWGYMKETDDGKKIQKYLTELQNEYEDFINWYKNHLLIKYFLESKGCNWLWNGWLDTPKEYEEFNRFDGEYGNLIDKGVDNFHPGPQHNYQYSTKLYKHIYNNFRSYLPDDVEPIQSILI